MIGKGVTYDTGGLNLKPGNSMANMYIDKGGASAVFGAFTGIVNLQLKKNVTMVVALAENAIGPEAYKPSEILYSHNGLSVEILNTDAEGRLMLADAMSYVQKELGCKKMVELSTLTGAIMASLGVKTGGLFCNDRQLASQLLASAQNRKFLLFVKNLFISF